MFNDQLPVFQPITAANVLIKSRRWSAAGFACPYPVHPEARGPMGHFFSA
jgi:hypothetical protein